MISKKLVFGLVLFVAIGLAIGTYSVRTNHNKTNSQTSKKVEASTNQAVITSQPDWDVGTKDNIDSSSSPGSIVINNSGSNTLSLSGKTTVASVDISNKDLPIDNNNDTYWRVQPLRSDATDYWKIDLGQNYNLKKISVFTSCAAIYNGEFYYSTDETNWTLLGFHLGCSDTPAITEGIIDVNARFIRYVPFAPVPDCPGAPSCGFVNFNELSLYIPATATHTTGSTQLNGGSDFFEWQTFTPTYTKPANTNVQFRFRSSTNSTDWTIWTDYQTPSSGSPLDITSLVTSRTGPTDSPTFYKYLQVETKLTSTDGTSNPTLSEYSIGYHTNRPPDKPVAGTVIIGN
ncbi:MAG: F5/8 type C domain protein [candidate division WS2 bacterium ADurb.Bin280]|uniref:F5/8 type C domain protein n=1 Tax=candidate division WS2 bacterium ADurb.Bin280 TaxID=1852829 RepID=A0A1V5SCV5_9BACT|nr:MAG: F5/8 type C domain protein [candidate division WS2 bacterium ADurb.Bin280]